jgi:hypothetical protein
MPADLPHLDFLRSFGDPIAAVMAVDMFERLVARNPGAGLRATCRY